MKPATHFRIRSASTLLLSACLAASPAWSSEKSDHERARQAVQSGQVLPLPAVLERLQREQPGQVLEVELEQDRGRWIYEVKLLKAGGDLVKLKLDAQTGALMPPSSRAQRPR